MAERRGWKELMQFRVGGFKQLIKDSIEGMNQISEVSRMSKRVSVS